MRQLLKDLDRALSDATCACYSKDHWGKLARHATSANVVSESCQCILHVVIVEVHVAAANQERRLELPLQQVLSDTTQEVKSSSNASIAAESDKTSWHLTLNLGFADALEVDEANIKLA